MLYVVEEVGFVPLSFVSGSSMKGEKEQKLIDVLEAEATAQGFELVDVELAGVGRARIIRVFLDKEGGLGIDELAHANGWVDAAIEANEPFTGSYSLEVSSPGIDRPLRTAAHFARFSGEEAKLVTEPVGGRANWTGVLAGVEGDDVLLAIDGQTHRLPLAKVKKAHLKGRVDFKKATAKGTDNVI
jgi:ribosome maturation factor RimP